MRKKIEILIILFAIIIGIRASDALENASVKVGLNEFQMGKGEPMLTMTSDENESFNRSYYPRSLKLALDQYYEDYESSSRILSDYVKKNLTEWEALDHTASIYMLNSRTLDDAKNMNPPKIYSNYHNHVLNALLELQNYLWNLSKFYETNNAAYVLEARKSYNLSSSYYASGRNDSRFNT